MTCTSGSDPGQGQSACQALCEALGVIPKTRKKKTCIQTSLHEQQNLRNCLSDKYGQKKKENKILVKQFPKNKNEKQAKDLDVQFALTFTDLRIQKVRDDFDLLKNSI